VFNTFGIEERFGFNRTTPRLFVIDMLKGLVVSLLLGAPLLAAVLWFMANAGAYWWIYAWLVWAGFSLLLTWAYPTFIAPWFNRFEALEDRDLQARIEALLQRCGFRSSGVFVMDGSRRSSHGNAYFTGLGAAKRIVFFDTLLKSLEPPEIEAVLAHELGHFRRHHIRKRLVTMLALGLAALGMLGWLKLQPGFYSGLGFSAVSDYAALTLFMVVAPLAGYFASPLAALLSRKHEFEADAFAVEHSDGPALIAALVKLYRDNATTLTPDRLHSLFYDSHPPAPIRIEHIEALVGRR
ncbi:MAG: M48 family metallopeptidase, partial [Chromatiales bacterium]|nr:M48 family metallopeptidase [Chromatiales bacterium]